jgi:CheY-like chemotaxis protein
MMVKALTPGKGDGATFIVTLPGQLRTSSQVPLVHLPTTEQEPLSIAAVTAAIQASASLTPLEGRHLLVVDDEPDTLNLVTMMLELAGAGVTSSYSARNAWEMLHEQSFDALICDISMPEEDGYTFIRRLRQSNEEFSGIPALALTAFARQEDRDRALAAGFNSHHPKPVDASSLTHTVLQMLQTEETMSAAALGHSLPR